MKMIMVLLVAALFFVLSSAVFAADDYDQGYEFASDKNLTDSTKCTGKSDDFRRGCVDYIMEQDAESF